MFKMPQFDNSEDSAERPASANRNEAVSELFRANNRALISFLLTHLSNEGEAREVAQESYIKLLQLDRPEAVSFLRAYLFRIAANLAIDRIRRRDRKDRIERLDLFDEPPLAPSAEDEATSQQDLALVRQAIGELKPSYQTAFAMNKFLDRSITDVAAAMDLTPRMVRVYVTRAVFYCRLRLDGCSQDAAYKAMMELPS
jgi:RNA polymerase sigma factor (sigma-70 family)